MKILSFTTFMIFSLYSHANLYEAQCRKVDDVRRNILIQQNNLIIGTDDPIEGQITEPTVYKVQRDGTVNEGFYHNREIAFETGFLLDELNYVPLMKGLNKPEVFGALIEDGSRLPKHYIGEYICLSGGMLKLEIDRSPRLRDQDEGLIIVAQ